MRARLDTAAMCASVLRIGTTRVTRLLKEDDPAKAIFAGAAAQGLSLEQIAHKVGTSVEIVRQMLVQQPEAVKQAIRRTDTRP